MTDSAPSPPDVFDPRRYVDGIPHESFAWLREHDPVSWQHEHPVGDWPGGPGFWAVTRHEDVVRVLRSPTEFSSWSGATQIRDPAPEDLDFLRRMMLNMDPPEHNKLRRIVSRAFTPRRVTLMRRAVARRARELVDAVAERGECDLPAEVTDDFPLLNLADLLGVPESDRGRLLEWTNRVIGYQDPDHAGTAVDATGRPVDPRSPEQLGDMFSYARELAEHKRRHPADDLMSVLATAEVNGRGLSEAELGMFFFLLSVAGNDTVRSALPGGMRAFAEHPEQHRALWAKPELLDSAVEETLRYHPPVLSFRRTATTDLNLAGRAVRAGEKVVVFHCSAHFDRRAFPRPYEFDVRRSPNGHLAFGDGPHVCLGAHFARMQLRAFYAEALWRMPELELAGPTRRLVSNFVNGIKHMPIRFVPNSITRTRN
ncbi:Cytochrome P450 [Actinopolyspora xinjiangensis]|uniref:Cytochrome P450 n=1 Tax=Actinopolyspora xinjiangensis TaxID=405564 RepID=A0A1H0QFZ1_9ACTN|nr:cytochrome P450 [Actinopolyspora xinjiangensis]SDP15649.1 Cytochrome P450 [Actinopolyspora xinjiangensis]